MNRDESSARGRLIGALLVAALAFALYVPTARHGFLNYDDNDYVTANPVVARGIDAAGVRWAFGFHAANWHPLTWLSHMLDVEVFGVAPGPMHVENAALHGLNAALCFLAFAALTRALWPSLLVALLFAVHPLRVQSVAWIAERKDLLAGSFFFALLLAYARHARTRSLAAYVAMFFCLALGLMAKPMLVTAPFVLLLLDAWPLARTRAGGESAPAPAARLVLEKLPLFALAAGASVATVLAQSAGGAVGTLPLVDRLATAGSAVVSYVRATVWPSGLAVFYPHPLLVGGSVRGPGLIGGAVVLGGLVVAWLFRRRAPALLVGGCWFLGMLVPVVGLVQVGDQAWADRYAYLPTVGLYVAAVFGAFELLAVRRDLLRPLALATVAGAAALAIVTWRTLPSWRDNRALFERALDVTENNWVAHNNLGLVYLERREHTRAREQFEAAARANPRFPNAAFNLARTLEAEGDFPTAVQAYLAFLQQVPGHADALLSLAALARADGEPEQATEFYEQALRANPGDARIWTGFAQLLLERGEPDRAANCATSALQIDPDRVEAHLVLGEIALARRDVDEAKERLAKLEELAAGRADTVALRARLLAMQGDLTGARAEFERALALDPNSVRARFDFGTLLLAQGERDAARSQFKAVNDLHPGDPQAATALAFLLLEDGKAEEAVELLEKALKRMPGSLRVINNLGAAYERLGRWREAVDTYQRGFQPGQPPTPEAASSVAWILATGPDEELLDGARAVELATFAAKAQASNAVEILAAALARNGDFDRAITLQEQVLQRAKTPPQEAAQRARLELYRARQPYTRPR